MNDFFPYISKRPRHYASEIAQLKTREERLAALERVPPEMRGIVKTHVTNTLLLVWFWRNKIAKDPNCARPKIVDDLLGEYPE